MYCGGSFELRSYLPIGYRSMMFVSCRSRSTAELSAVIEQ